MIIINYIEEEKKRAEEEMISALKAKTAAISLASTGSSSYNKPKDTNSYGSYTGSKTGFTAASNYLPGSVSKKETFVPKPKVEDAVKTPSIGETYRAKTSNINGPLPRSDPNESFNNWAKEKFGESKAPLQNSNVGENYGFTPENAETRTSPMYQKQAPKLNLDLLTMLQRGLGKGALGDERETEVYNDNVFEEFARLGYMRNTKTQDDYFHEGFYDVELPNKYAFTDKADDNVKAQLFSLLDFGKTPESRMNALSKIREEKSMRNEGVELHAAKRPEDNKPELDPNVRIIPTPKADFALEWHAARKPDAQAIHEGSRAETGNAYGSMSNATEIIGYGEKPYEMFEKVSQYTANVAGEYDEALKTLDWLEDSSNLKAVKSTRRLASGAKAIGYAGVALDTGLTYIEHLEEGHDTGEVIGRTAINTLAKVGFSAACTKGGASVGASIGTMICPGLGTAIGAGIGFLGGLVVDFFASDDVSEFAEEIFYD